MGRINKRVVCVFKGAVVIVLRVCVICVSLQGQPREASWSQCQRLPKRLKPLSARARKSSMRCSTRVSQAAVAVGCFMCSCPAARSPTPSSS